jgi:two-component system response regulator (stage 0 sporulation protein F)
MKLAGIKILVVDDDKLLRDTLCDILEFDGAETSQAGNGDIAFEMIKNNDYNIIISDVRMPGASGIDLLNNLKEYENKAPEIIMMSAYSDLTEEKAKQLGASALFLKPTKVDEIKELILELVN